MMNANNTKLKPLKAKSSLNSVNRQIPSTLANNNNPDKNLNKGNIPVIGLEKKVLSNSSEIKKINSNVGSIGSTGNTKSNLKQKRESINNNVQKPTIKRSQKTRERSTKTIEFYDCDDFENPMVDQQEYFRGQIQKNIKLQIMNSTNKIKNQPKNQIVLPKLQTQVKTKQIKDLEKEMDQEMSGMMDKQMDNDYY